MRLEYSPVVVLLIVCVLSTAGRAADWRKVETGSLAWLHAIQFVDADRGWAGGSNGTLLTTIDGGSSWKKARIPVTDTIRDIYFQLPMTGWLLVERDRFQNTKANRSYLLRTNDGGGSWSAVEFSASAERYARMFFSTSGQGFVVGEGGLVAAIPNTGEADAPLVLPEKYLMLSGISLGPERLLLVGGGGSIFWTEDRGKNWNTARFNGTAPTAKLNAVNFVDRDSGWAAGNGGSIFRTIDGGRTWQKQATPTGSDLYDISFQDKEFGYAVGENGLILRTLDAGRTWVQMNSSLKHRLERLAFSGERVFAVGFGGTFLTAKLADERSSVSGSQKR